MKTISFFSLALLCSLPFFSRAQTDQLHCDSFALLKDTVYIDFEKNETDLKFSYKHEAAARFALPYPNYAFVSNDPILEISPDSSRPNQTFLLFSDTCSGLHCPYYIPFHFGMTFTLKKAIQVDTFVRGVFVIGQLNTSKKCVSTITYHLRPSDFTTDLASHTPAVQVDKLLPSPASDYIAVPNSGYYSIKNLLGIAVQEGYHEGAKIDVSGLLQGSYLFCPASGKAMKFVKE